MGDFRSLERQVMGLIAERFSNQEIDERLFITERTVRFYVTLIFNKLGADKTVRRQPRLRTGWVSLR